MLAIDHVILGVHDLDAATRRMEALGFGVVDGGRHEGPGPPTASCRSREDPARPRNIWSSSASSTGARRRAQRSDVRDAAEHPGLTPVKHRVTPLAIAWVEVATDDPAHQATS